ncbi:MAG: hypothetical protein HRU10_01170 [Opitutales bacterium]|nr:hypothetical protein [Opitutales bacterium]
MKYSVITSLVLAAPASLLADEPTSGTLIQVSSVGIVTFVMVIGASLRVRRQAAHKKSTDTDPA